MTPDTRLSRTHVAAFLHDPMEKALVLMRIQGESHEMGTSEDLRRTLGLSPLAKDIAAAVKQADHWASAADRAAFPKDIDGARWPEWQKVRFHERPTIIHPLTGEAFSLQKLSEVDPHQVKAIARAHLEDLIHRDGEGQPDFRRTALAFWRFGPEERQSELGELWPQLPADTRVPDHTIFDHLDFVTALAGSIQQDPDDTPAHLVVSLGPVQPFIAAARSTSDLWAGSHLLARMSWEAMKVVCERLGPQHIVFPRLRGVPWVDRWLRDEEGLDRDLFEDADWTRRGSDANPLFAAALPNRFTALVPASQAREIAEAITARVRAWIKDEAVETYRRLLEEADIPDHPDLPGYAQIERQLEGFPEVQWTAVPWSLAKTNQEGRIAVGGTKRLAETLAPFFESTPPGFLGSPVWQIMEEVIEKDRGDFWPPNPGMLYPAWFDLAERSLAAVKSLRPFGALQAEGWRDSLTGEQEWLTTDREHLKLSSGQRKQADTLWNRIAKRRPAWAKPGEHLAVLGAVKRLWPTRYAESLEGVLGDRPPRFVVSTHTMAIATSLARAIDENREPPEALREAIAKARPERPPLPRRLAERLRDHPDRDLIRALPGWLDALNEKDDQGRRDEAERRRAERLLKDYLDHAPEKYYALILMDGDRMGAWLGADPEVVKKRYQDSFHEQVRAGLERQASELLRRYGEAPRAATPAWHMTISEALNHFSLRLAPEVIEGRFHGRVLYAGGDDLMAMLPVGEVLEAMACARAAYSGVDPGEMGAPTDLGYQRQANGFVLHRGRLLRLMGADATASCGAVVAHHKAPLGAVLRALRAAEQRAKQEGGRNAFSLTVVKRSGGAQHLTAPWGESLRLLIRLRDFLADPATSRRAAYNVLAWLPDLPEPRDDTTRAMLAEMLAYQFQRQCSRKAARDHHDLPGLARGLVERAVGNAKRTPSKESAKDWLQNALVVAEFLAREGRPAHARTHAPTDRKEQTA